MQLSDMLTRVRDELKDAAKARFSDSVLTNWLSDALRIFQERTHWIVRRLDLSVNPLRVVAGGNPFYRVNGCGYDAARRQIWASDPTNTIPALYVFSRTASGNVIPLGSIKGTSNTTLVSPTSLFVDTDQGNLFVVDNGSSVKVWDPINRDDTAPNRNLTGAATTLSSAGQIGVDPINNELYVANTGTKQILVFDKSANGNTAPKRTISPSNSVNGPTGVYVDMTNNEIIVADAGQGLSVFPRTASGATAPIRTITLTGGLAAFEVTMDEANGEYYVTVQAAGNIAAQAIYVFKRLDNGSLTAPDRIVWKAAGQDADTVTPIYQPTEPVFDSVFGQLMVSFIRPDGAIASFLTKTNGRKDFEAPPGMLALEMASASGGYPLLPANYRKAVVPVYPMMKPGNFWLISKGETLSIGVFPGFTDDLPVVVWYAPQAPALVSTTDEPPIPDGFCMHLIDYALAMALPRDDDLQKAALFLAKWEDWVQSVQSSVEERQAEAYGHIQNEWTEDEGLDLAYGHFFVP